MAMKQSSNSNAKTSAPSKSVVSARNTPGSKGSSNRGASSVRESFGKAKLA